MTKKKEMSRIRDAITKVEILMALCDWVITNGPLTTEVCNRLYSKMLDANVSPLNSLSWGEHLLFVKQICIATTKEYEALVKQFMMFEDCGKSAEDMTA